MRNTLFTLVTLTTMAIGPAAEAASLHAAPAAPSDQSLYTCAKGGFSHVALAADPAPCCTGSFGCPQLLSNTGFVKRKRDNRT